MKFKEYRELAKRTLPDLGSQMLNSVHMVMGTASETYELYDAFTVEDKVNIKEEFADKLWYTANLINILDLDIEYDFDISIDDLFDIPTGYIYIESRLLDIFKKQLVYGKAPDLNEVTNLVKGLLASYQEGLIVENIDASHIMTNNINKLKVRYPEKFEKDQAINRDLDSERKALENNG
jgi:NTP pyrophosphatase (non-canonical NTP hydrolase)